MDNNILNKASEILDDYEIYDALKIAYYILDLVSNDVKYNIENDDDEKEYYKLKNCITQLWEILKNNERKDIQHD